MKKSLLLIVFVLSLFGICAEEVILNKETYASYYGDAFNGRMTSSGEIFDMNAFTAAHKTLPFGTMVEVTNLENGKKVIVRINDRGPFVGNREIDLSKAAAQALDMMLSGIIRVSIKKVDGNAEKENAEVPAEPDFSETPQQSPMPYDNSQADNPSSEKKLVYQPTTPEETPGPLWRIQLGSFAREENALRLVVQLRKIGFEPAYERTDTSIRVVLYGITPSDLEKVKLVLEENRFRDYILKQESW